jgi:putative transposase
VTTNKNSARANSISPEQRARIERVAFDLRLSAEARAYLWAAIDEGPSRRVQGRMGNVVVGHFSKKMGIRLLVESRRGEHAQAILLERDPDVLAYFAQPPASELVLEDESGRPQTTTRYTPDFLVVRTDGIAIIEMRDLNRLFERHHKNPHQFYPDTDGRWHFRAAEKRFTALGFQYVLRANSELPRCLVENTRFLEDYVSEACPPLTDDQVLLVQRAVSDRRVASFQDLLSAGCEADLLFKAVADGVVYVDLATDRLAATSDLVICTDATTHAAHRMVQADKPEPPLPIPGTVWLRPGSQLRYSGGSYTVLLTNERDVLLRDSMGQQSTMGLDALMQAHKVGLVETDGILNEQSKTSIADLSSDELQRAMKRLEALRNGDTREFSERSLSRFRQRTAGKNELEALLALVDHQRLKGNKTPRISETNLELIEKVIEEHYNTPENRLKTKTYDLYSARCEETKEPHGGFVRPVSYPTFCKYVDEFKSTKARRGRRAAYQEGTIGQTLEFEFPVHGVRPHEICYIDHTTANIALISPHGNQMGKPTLTVGVDGNTAKPRALILTFDPPSAWTVLMVLRDYVRRHKRLPRVIAVDNGADFHSHALDFFCRLYGIEIRYRSPGEPRGGAMIERLLGATEDEVLSSLVGNTRLMKTDTRLVTKSVDPFRRAEWTLPGLYKAMEEYLFVERPNRPHPALGCTPNEFEQRRLQETGQREFLGVQFDENLMLLTSPHPRVRFHKVDPQRGVWTNGMWYQAPALRTLRKSTRVEVRIEPWNASVVYVHVGTRWVAAIGNSSRWLVRRTQRELELALRAEKRKANADAHRAAVSKRARHGRIWVAKDFDPRLAEQQAEMRHLYDALGMSTALSEPREAVPPSAIAASPAALPLHASQTDGDALGDDAFSEDQDDGEAIPLGEPTPKPPAASPPPAQTPKARQPQASPRPASKFDDVLRGLDQLH